MFTDFGKLLVAVAFGAVLVAPAMAGSCTGAVVDVGPFDRYDHQTGVGFLAVRTGPGVENRQTGELYPGDLVTVQDRSGKWYRVGCMSGQCVEPLWGQSLPHGWVSGRYLEMIGECP